MPQKTKYSHLSREQLEAKLGKLERERYGLVWEDKEEDFKVTNRKTFIKFIDLLRKDLLENSKNWENKTLPDFLEALSSYTEDIQGYYDNTKQNIDADNPDWSTFADILKGATIYE